MECRTRAKDLGVLARTLTFLLIFCYLIVKCKFNRKYTYHAVLFMGTTSGILVPLIKQPTEVAITAELDHHLANSDEANRKNGKGSKTIKTGTGSFEQLSECANSIGITVKYINISHKISYYFKKIYDDS